jgi:hypothetical protein
VNLSHFRDAGDLGIYLPCLSGILSQTSEGPVGNDRAVFVVGALRSPSLYVLKLGELIERILLLRKPRGRRHQAASSNEHGAGLAPYVQQTEHQLLI